MGCMGLTSLGCRWCTPRPPGCTRRHVGVHRMHTYSLRLQLKKREDVPQVPPEPADPTKPCSATRAKPRSQIANDGQPSPETMIGVQDPRRGGDGPPDCRAGPEQFRDYHQGKGSLMADWTAAWRTWWGKDYHGHPRRVAGGAPVESSADPRAKAERHAPDQGALVMDTFEPARSIYAELLNAERAVIAACLMQPARIPEIAARLSPDAIVGKVHQQHSGYTRHAVAGRAHALRAGGAHGAG